MDDVDRLYPRRSSYLEDKKMNDKLITALLAVLLALGGWNLQRTFSLSQDMVLIKEKVSGIEQDFKNKKRKDRKKKKRNN